MCSERVMAKGRRVIYTYLFALAATTITVRQRRNKAGWTTQPKS